MKKMYVTMLLIAGFISCKKDETQKKAFQEESTVARTVSGSAADRPLFINVTNGKVFWLVDGLYRHIYNQRTVDALFGGYNYSMMPKLYIDPQPQGEPIGSGPDIQHAFMAQDTKDGKVYVVEKKAAGSGQYYNFCRYVWQDFFNLHLLYGYLNRVNIQFTDFPLANTWFKGDDLKISGGHLINYSGKVYWKFEGTYRWIYNYETAISLFGGPIWSNSSIAPSPIGSTLGGDPAGQRYGFLANDLNDGKVYFVERKRVNESDANSPLYNYCRHIYSMEVFGSYMFNSSQIENYTIQFSSTPSADAWILGPVIYQ
ncbi:hypothetical protein ACLOAU_23800 [Niabella sp. CJ426]|uniref:hypothetical protein n=1 Tax=Niabella sp. CJ426 TaxID=3393740 RepID=UPI003D06D56D